MSENIFFNKSGDQKMDSAMKEARATFKYFWRELSWEYRRIIPAHDLSIVKIGFETDAEGDVPQNEFIWMSELEFDGKYLQGRLMNQPNWISTLNAGDSVQVSLEQVADWLYAIGGKAYGGYSVNAMRSSMSKTERNAHDKAWGLDFGSPDSVEVCYKQPIKWSFKHLLKKPIEETDAELMQKEHPMCVNMEGKIREQLQKAPEVVHQKIDNSDNTMLHSEALAGNALSVALLLEFGADKDAKNCHGQTAKELADLLKWNSVTKLFQ